MAAYLCYKTAALHERKRDKGAQLLHFPPPSASRKSAPSLPSDLSVVHQMDATGKRGLRQPALFVFLLLAGVFLSAADGLNIGIQSTGAGDAASKQQACSRKCESEHCTVPPFLRYGKYCGILYSGCPGEKPCDGLDACCMAHDACVQAKHNDYLSQECSEKFLNCIARFKEEDGPTFKGNKCMVHEVVDVITLVMEAALLAGRVLHKP